MNSEILAIRKKMDEAEKELSINERILKRELEMLKEEFGIASLEEAEEMIEELRKKRDELEDEITKEYKRIFGEGVIGLDT